MSRAPPPAPPAPPPRASPAPAPAPVPKARLLAELSRGGPPRLRHVSTVVTDATGRRHKEERREGGGFESDDDDGDSSGGGGGVFMVEDTDPDEELHRVVDGLFIGSQDAAANLDGIRERGVTHVVNCAAGIANMLDGECEYLNLALLDLPEADASAHFDAASEWIADAIGGGGAVLVHCNAGVSRSAAIVVAHLVRRHGHSPVDALALLRESRPQARPNVGFMRQLHEYHASRRAGSKK